MGLLDSVLGQVLGGVQQQQQPGGAAGGLEGLSALAGMGGLDALLGGNAGSGAGGNAAGGGLAQTSFPPGGLPAGYKLVWADGFVKDGLPDPAKWEVGFLKRKSR